nr:hydroxycinnamoyl-CoA quinate/shikimate transferase [Tanacetum cinerariifolium]
LFKENGGANSRFLVFNQASEDFTLGGRIAWVEVEGNLNQGHLDEGCVKNVNEEVVRDDNSFVYTVGGKENSRSVNKMSDSMGSCRLKKSRMPCTGGSILNFMEEVMKLGQTMGYNIDGCVKDITEIIKSQGEFGVHR